MLDVLQGFEYFSATCQIIFESLKTKPPKEKWMNEQSLIFLWLLKHLLFNSITSVTNEMPCLDNDHQMLPRE